MSKLLSKSQLKNRLNKLPYDIRNDVRAEVIQTASVSPATFHNVLSSKSENLAVLKAMSDILDCSINDLLDSRYAFDPSKIKLQQLHAA